MSSTLEAILALAESDVPELLISRHALLTLKSVCRLLPICFSSGFGFESRLAKDSPEVDLIVRVPAVPGLEILAGVDRSCSLPNHFFSEPSWEKLRNLALDWQTWPKKLRDAVLYVWLEFDADQLSDPVPNPGLLFLQMGKPQHSYEECYWVTQRAYEIINKRPVHPEMAQAFHTCVERLPRHGSIIHVGVGMARATEAIRLVLGDLSPGDFLNYLGSTGWPGDLRTIEPFFQDLRHYTVRFNLALDVLSSVRPRVGFECFMDRQEHPAKDLDWRNFLQFTREMGWCCPQKSAGLLAWPGRNLFWDAKESWPWVVERMLSHIKISFDAGSGAEAKAYFGFEWRPLATGQQIEGVRGSQQASLDHASGERRDGRTLDAKPLAQSPGMTMPESLQQTRLSECLRRAVHFLRENQLPWGEFKTYTARDQTMESSCVYVSSPFVTTFVLYALGLLDDSCLNGMKSKGMKFLADEMIPPGLWKYWGSRSARWIDPDLDDTGCASFALRRVHPEIQAGMNIDTIIGNRNSQGLFYTWLISPGSGCNDVDSVVNANILLYLGEGEETKNACDYLNAIIRENREQGSYVYYLDDLALYYAVSRAYVNGISSLGPSRDKIISRITARRLKDGSFGNELLSALAICSLLNYSCEDTDLLRPAVKFIITSQGRYGSWPKKAFYGGPSRPPHEVWFGSEELTTAFCIEALAGFSSKFCQLERSSDDAKQSP